MNGFLVGGTASIVKNYKNSTVYFLKNPKTATVCIEIRPYRDLRRPLSCNINYCVEATHWKSFWAQFHDRCTTVQNMFRQTWRPWISYFYETSSSSVRCRFWFISWAWRMFHWASSFNFPAEATEEESLVVECLQDLPDLIFPCWEPVS